MPNSTIKLTAETYTWDRSDIEGDMMRLRDAAEFSRIRCFNPYFNQAEPKPSNPNFTSKEARNRQV
jgi:hypothetical protein